MTASSQTTPSHEQQTNLSVAVYEPSITYVDPNVTDYTPEGSYVETLTEQLETYSHTIEAVGGYWNARITINDRLEKIEDWLERGLNRHVEVYDEAQVTIWEGFVNVVRANIGNFSVVRGPLIGIANRVSAEYSELITATSPPTTGATMSTTIVNDATSAAKYSIFEKVLSAGTQETAMANRIRDAYLVEYALPETDKRWNNQPASRLSVTLDCLGYVHRFNSYIYNDTPVAVPVTEWLETKLGKVINADPNQLFALTNASIEQNHVPVSEWDDDNRLAWAVIKGLIAYGDDSLDYLRTLFGVYANRHIIYANMSDTIEYHQRMSDPAQSVTTPAGMEIKPWNVLPGKWLLFPDYLIGRSMVTAAVPSDLRTDPRAMFIERVTYTAPRRLVLDGGKTKGFPQRLASLGLGGI